MQYYLKKYVKKFEKRVFQYKFGLSGDTQLMCKKMAPITFVCNGIGS